MGRDMPFSSRRRRMHQTLRWHRLGVEENLAALRDGLARKAAALPGGERAGPDRTLALLGGGDPAADRFGTVGGHARRRA